MGHAITNIIGQKFNRLTALRFVRIDHGAVWEWRCECGNIVERNASNVKRGRTKSCGCVMRNRCDTWKEVRERTAEIKRKKEAGRAKRNIKKEQVKAKRAEHENQRRQLAEAKRAEQEEKRRVAESKRVERENRRQLAATKRVEREQKRLAARQQAEARRIEREKQRQAKRQKSEIMARLAERMSQRTAEETPLQSFSPAYGSAYCNVHHDWIKGHPSPAPRSIYIGVFDGSGRRVALVAHDNNDAANALAGRCEGYFQKVKY